MKFDQLKKYIPNQENSQLFEIFESLDKILTTCTVENNNGFEIKFVLFHSEDQHVALFDEQHRFIVAANCGGSSSNHTLSLVRDFVVFCNFIKSTFNDEEDVSLGNFELL